MKQTPIFVIITLIFSVMHYSCKTKTVNNAYCVKVIQQSPSTLVLPASEQNVIQSLFNSNGMDFSNYQFVQLDTDELGFRHVRCYQFVNNLKVFSEVLIFHFNPQDAYYLVSGNIINSIGLESKPSLNQHKVAGIFIQQIAQEKASMVDQAILKGCFDIELGYVGLDGSTEKFAKAWKVNPTGKDYPFAYINDETSEIIYYDNGVRY